MQINNCILTLITDRPVVDSPTTLRGFIAGKFRNNPFLHNHSEKGFIYTYPKIQYKIIDKIPMILGIGEVSEFVEEILIIEYLNLKNKQYTVIDKKLLRENNSFGVINGMLSYKFLTPWLALDEESFNRYKKRNSGERKKQLESILIGNIISMAKGLEYVITDKIIAKVDVYEVHTSLKGTPMLGFVGTFSVNFEIPDYWGLGKSVSRGFGTVIKIGSVK
ncbi:MAG: CRISPR-associated endonuclease Cas6 [Acidobacteriota bacterium]